MSRSFDEEYLEDVVKKFDAVEWDTLMFTFKFKEIDAKLLEGEVGCFYNFYKDPSICFTPLVINFMKAALSSDKDLAKDTIKDTFKAIDTIKTRHCCYDDRGKEITVADFLSKSWTTKDLEAINQVTVKLDEENTANFSARALAVTSELYALIALLQIISGAYLKGAYNLRKAWKSYENLAKLNDFIEENDENDLTILNDKAYMSHFLLGYGAFHFFCSLVPSSFAWILKICGFTGNRDAGIKELYQCLNYGQRRSSFAGLVLLWIESFFYEDYTKGEQLFTKLVEEYPEGGLYYYMGGYLSRVQGNIKEAIKRFSTSHDLNTQFFEMENICKYELGWCYYLENKFEKAKDQFEEFLENHTSNTYKAWCYWQLGYCYYFLGEDEKADENMAMVKEFKRNHYSWDEYCFRKSKEFLKDVPHCEMQLQKIYNMIKCKDLKNARKMLEEYEDDEEVLNDNDLYSYFTYLKAKIEYHEDNWIESQELLEEILDMPKKEKYLSAFARYRLLLLKIKEMEDYTDDYHECGEEDLKYIKCMVRQVSKMSGYDFEKPLMRKIERVKDYFKETYNMKF